MAIEQVRFHSSAGKGHSVSPPTGHGAVLDLIHVQKRVWRPISVAADGASGDDLVKEARDLRKCLFQQAF